MKTCRDGPEGAYDFGLRASFYVEASEEPWATNYRMRRCLEEELSYLVEECFPADPERQSIMGHSMAGNGALTISLRNPAISEHLGAFTDRRTFAGAMGISWIGSAL